MLEPMVLKMWMVSPFKKAIVLSPTAQNSHKDSLWRWLQNRRCTPDLSKENTPKLLVSTAMDWPALSWKAFKQKPGWEILSVSWPPSTRSTTPHLQILKRIGTQCWTKSSNASQTPTRSHMCSLRTTSSTSRSKNWFHGLWKGFRWCGLQVRVDGLRIFLSPIEDVHTEIMESLL